jgi:hypothetical protein
MYAWLEDEQVWIDSCSTWTFTESTDDLLDWEKVVLGSWCEHLSLRGLGRTLYTILGHLGLSRKSGSGMLARQRWKHIAQIYRTTMGGLAVTRRLISQLRLMIVLLPDVHISIETEARCTFSTWLQTTIVRQSMHEAHRPSRCQIRLVNNFIVSSCSPNLARSNSKAIPDTMASNSILRVLILLQWSGSRTQVYSCNGEMSLQQSGHDSTSSVLWIGLSRSCEHNWLAVEGGFILSCQRASCSYNKLVHILVGHNVGHIYFSATPPKSTHQLCSDTTQQHACQFR